MAAYIRNQCLTHGTKLNLTPYEIFWNEKPDLTNLRVFGSKCILYNADPNKKKLDDRGIEGIFVGYPDLAHGYAVYLPSTQKITISRTVKFFEFDQQLVQRRVVVDPDESEEELHDSSQLRNSGSQNSNPGNPDPEIEEEEVPNSPPSNNDTAGSQVVPATPQTPVARTAEILTPSRINIPERNPSSENSNTVSSPIIASETRPRNEKTKTPTMISTTKPTTSKPSAVTQVPEVRKSFRPTKPSLKAWENLESSKPKKNLTNKSKEKSSHDALLAIDEIHYALLSAEPRLQNDPKSFREAVSGEDAEKWIESMEHEISSLTDNKTYTLVPCPEAVNIVGSRFVYRKKRNADGSIAKYKSRLVAQGFTQEPFVDFNETYAPTSKADTIRTLFAIAASKGFEVHSIDISTAYINANITEEIYMEQPPGFKVESNDGTRLVCKLHKSLYGLKQSGRNWNLLITKWLVDYGFKRSAHDPCLFVLNQEGTFVLLTIHVDDLLICSK